MKVSSSFCVSSFAFFLALGRSALGLPGTPAPGPVNAEAAAPQGGLDPAVADRVGRELGVRRFSLREIQLPASLAGDKLPDSLRVTVEHEGEVETLLLRRRSVRSREFRLLVQKAGGSLVEAPAPPERTYRGWIEGEPETLVAASLLPSGLHAKVSPEGRGGWRVRPLGEIVDGARPEVHVVFSEADAEPLELPCRMLFPPWADDPSAPGGAGGDISEGSDDHDAPGSGDRSVTGGAEADGAPGAERGSGAASGTCTLKVADLAFDSDYEFYDKVCGRDADRCLSFVEDGVNEINLVYVRDLKITHRLSTVVVRSDPDADFYKQFPDASDFGAMLDAFRREWNANMTHIVKDMAYYVTGKGNPQYGGLAWVSTTCSNYAYGMGLDDSFAAILRHELGHNWSAGHDCGLERRYIMCGNSIDAFSAFNIDKITRFRDSRSCLEDLEYTSDPEAPYARPDIVQTVAQEGPMVVEVLKGDTDRNCDELRIAAHDARSAFGAEIRVVDSLEAGARDALLYLPRSSATGTDTFRYTVSDGAGFDVPCTVFVKVQPRELVAYWRLDETSGTTVADSSGHGREGELRGELSFAADSVPGRFGNALQFRGRTDDYISVEHDPSLDLAGGLTAAAWFQISAFAQDGETIVSKGDSAWRLKRDGTRNALKFTCTGVAGEEVKGNVAVADGKWHHAAGVYDGSRLSLYIDGKLDASMPASGRVDTNTSSVHIGDNGWSGKIDEVRLYSHGMSAQEVDTLYRGARAENPEPADGDVGVNPGASLSWVGSPAATQHDLYVGVDRNAVAAATAASPEYRGRVSTTSSSPQLDPGKTYFWRVDGVAGGEILPGGVWAFTTSFAYTNFDEPALNASSYRPRPGAKELGFTTDWSATDGQDPLAAVVDTSSTPTSPVLSHRSVRATTAFDTVDLADRAGAAVSFLLQARDTGYEPEDSLEAYVTDSSGDRIYLLRMDGGPSLSQFAGSGYQRFTASLPESWDTASLVFGTASNSSQGSERFDLDSVGFSCQGLYRVIAYSRFEEPAVGATSYVPGPGDAELGFRTAFAATGGTSPLAAVSEAGSSAGSRTLTHRSVTATTTFDRVDLADTAGGAEVRASVVLRVRDTSYESEDLLEVFATSGVERVDLIRVNGDTGFDDLATGDYRSYGASIPLGWGDATLVVKSATNSGGGSEQIDVCAVEFVGTPTGSPCGEPLPPHPTFRRGDANEDGKVDLSDGVRILGFLFLGGTQLDCLDAADSNDSGGLDLTDAVRIFNFLFLGADPLPAPGHEACGPDPTDGDRIGCQAYTKCP